MYSHRPRRYVVYQELFRSRMRDWEGTMWLLMKQQCHCWMATATYKWFHQFYDMLFSSITEMAELKEYDNWFSMGVTGNLKHDASSNTLNGIQFFSSEFWLQTWITNCNIPCVFWWSVYKTVWVTGSVNRELARAKVPRSPWHLLTTVSICRPKVKCWSKVTPSNFTVFCGSTQQLSKRKLKFLGILLPTGLKTINWVFEELITSSCESKNSLTLLKLTVRFWATTVSDGSAAARMVSLAN